MAQALQKGKSGLLLTLSHLAQRIECQTPNLSTGRFGELPPHRSVADQVLIGVVLEVAASQEEPELIAP